MKILALLAFIVQVGSPTARPAALPWTTFTEMVQGDNVQLNMTACMEGPVMILRIPYKTANYNVFVPGDANGAIVLAFDPNPDDMNIPFTEVGFGRVDTAHPDVIPPLRWETYSREKHGNICPYLYPAGG